MIRHQVASTIFTAAVVVLASLVLPVEFRSGEKGASVFASPASLIGENNAVAGTFHLESPYNGSTWNFSLRVLITPSTCGSLSIGPVGSPSQTFSNGSTWTGLGGTAYLYQVTAPACSGWAFDGWIGNACIFFTPVQTSTPPTEPTRTANVLCESGTLFANYTAQATSPLTFGWVLALLGFLVVVGVAVGAAVYLRSRRPRR
jgi:hypothetical protein